jgi:hypothetical protein
MTGCIYCLCDATSLDIEVYPGVALDASLATALPRRNSLGLEGKLALSANSSLKARTTATPFEHQSILYLTTARGVAYYRSTTRRVSNTRLPYCASWTSLTRSAH